MATILAVDDDPTARDLLVTVLRYGGHRLREAADGAEALTAAQAAHGFEHGDRRALFHE